MQHFPKNTESARAWCGKCSAFTDHKVSNGQLVKSHCLTCAEKQEAERLARPKPAPQARQEGFDFAQVMRLH
jgi:ribosomal protein L44E